MDLMVHRASRYFYDSVQTLLEVKYGIIALGVGFGLQH